MRAQLHLGPEGWGPQVYAALPFLLLHSQHSNSGVLLCEGAPGHLHEHIVSTEVDEAVQDMGLSSVD